MKTITVILVSAASLALAGCAANTPANQPMDNSSASASMTASEVEQEMIKICTDGPRRKARYGRAASKVMMQDGWRKVEAADGEAAAKSFLTALFIGPERPDAYWALGVAAHVADYRDGTIDTCFERAQRMLPEVAGVFSDHGRVLEERDRFDAAIAKFKQALALDPDFVEAHVGLSRAYAKTGETAKARAHDERVRTLRKAKE